jgi:chlorobactene glucosyltransferase
LNFQYGLAAFVIGLLLIAVSNLKAWRRMNRYPASPRSPRVSILVPARDEEDNIEVCVRSLLAQDYSDFEVVALNDESTDRTGAILAALDGESRLRVLNGKPLPPDWLGKHWACHQLAQAATGELLLFTDADTRHHPLALRDAVGALHAERADLLTALPRQIVGSWAERLIVPIIPWSLFALVPLALAHRLRRTSLVVAVGQYMLLRREAYDRSGGHAAVRQNAVDDIALGRRVVASGLRWRLVDGGERVRCRMYRNTRQVIEGLSKNLFAAFDYRWPPFLFVWAWMGLVFVIWPMLSGLRLLGIALPGFSLEAASVAVAGSSALWFIVARRFGLPAYLALLYPVSMALIVIIAFRSMAITLTGKATWRGRTLAAQK